MGHAGRFLTPLLRGIAPQLYVSSYDAEVASPSAPTILPRVKRLGLNHGGYFGERIDLDATLSGCASAARRQGWEVDVFPAGRLDLLAFHRKAKAPGAKQIYLSAGMHGDEPAGPCAALRLLEEDL